MWCNNCNRVFTDQSSERCPVCKQGKLEPSENIDCPNCKTPMEIGYFSIPLRIDWRSKWVKGAKPDIIIKDENPTGGWVRRVTYYCEKCKSFFLDKIKEVKKVDKETDVILKISLLCPQCGKEKTPTAKFCPFCGKKFEEITNEGITRVKPNGSSNK